MKVCKPSNIHKWTKSVTVSKLWPRWMLKLPKLSNKLELLSKWIRKSHYSCYDRSNKEYWVLRAVWKSDNSYSISRNPSSGGIRATKAHMPFKTPDFILSECNIWLQNSVLMRYTRDCYGWYIASLLFRVVPSPWQWINPSGPCPRTGRKFFFFQKDDRAKCPDWYVTESPDTDDLSTFYYYGVSINYAVTRSGSMRREKSWVVRKQRLSAQLLLPVTCTDSCVIV